MNWSRKSNRGNPQCGAFAVGPLVGAPGVGGMTPGLYRRASAAEAPLPRASLCLRTVFRGSAEVFVRLFSGRRGRSLRAAVCEAVHGSDVSPPLEKRVTPALRCAQRYAEVKGEPFGLQSARGGFAAAVNPFSLRVPLFARAVICASAGAFARLLIGRGGVFALCRIRGGGRNPLGQRQALRFA